jgi:hypothetical protein
VIFPRVESLLNESHSFPRVKVSALRTLLFLARLAGENRPFGWLMSGTSA